MYKNLYISLSGNLGSGKTTAGKLLARHFDFPFVEENVEGNPFLSRFYKDPKKWAFQSELFFLIEKIKNVEHIRKLLENSSVVGDTAIYQDIFSFAQTQHYIGNLSDVQWDIYQRIFNSVDSLLPTPDLIVYLDVSIDVVLKRIIKRNRPYEKDITRKNLLLLEKFNKAWKQRFKEKIRFVTIKTEDINLVNNDKDKNAFVGKVERALS